MAQQLFANNAFSSLASTITNVATSITLATGHGARFPTPTGGDHFLATLVGIDSNGNENAWEIVKITTRSADVLTVVRGQEGSIALPWSAGSRIELRATSGTFGGLLQLSGGTITGPVSVVNGAYTALKVGVTGLVSVGGEAGSSEAKFTITDAGNVGLEFSPTAVAGSNRILSYNRASMAFVPMMLMALSHKFNVSGTDMLTVDSTGMSYTGTLTGGTGVVNLGSGQLYKAADGKVGFGTTSPSYKIDIRGAAGVGWQLYEESTGTNKRLIVTQEATTVRYNATYSSGGNAHTWANGGTDQMVLDGSGDLTVGSTTGARTALGRLGAIHVNNTNASDSGVGVYLVSARAADLGRQHIYCMSNTSTLVFQVYNNGNTQNLNNSYGAISDLKLKENITDVSPKLAKLMQVRIVNYTLKSDPDKTKLIGVIAQELEQISPGLIEETPDYKEVKKTREVEVPAVDAVLDDKGNEVTPAVEATTRTEEYTERVDLGTTTKAVKYSIFVPMLIKGMQEQQAQIEAQAVVIQALQSQLDAQNTAMQLLVARLEALEAK